MDPTPSTVRQIDHIATEVSGILRAIGEPIPAARADDDEATRRRIQAARAHQLSDRERFLKRYQPAILAFVGTILNDPAASSTVWETFVDKWLHGKLAGYDPHKGSFRKYLKTVLRNDCRQHWKRLNRYQEVQLASDYELQDHLQDSASRAFDSELQELILDRALQAVKADDEKYYEIVLYMTKLLDAGQPRPRAYQLARHLSTRTGHVISEANARQMRKRAKDLFATKIIEQTGILIDSADLLDIEDALVDLNMIQYCRQALEKLKA